MTDHCIKLAVISALRKEYKLAINNNDTIAANIIYKKLTTLLLEL